MWLEVAFLIFTAWVASCFYAHSGLKSFEEEYERKCITVFKRPYSGEPASVF